MPTVETIKVEHPDGFCVINKADFDPKKHTEYKETASKKKASAKKASKASE